MRGQTDRQTDGDRDRQRQRDRDRETERVRDSEREAGGQTNRQADKIKKESERDRERMCVCGTWTDRGSQRKREEKRNHVSKLTITTVLTCQMHSGGRSTLFNFLSVARAGPISSPLLCSSELETRLVATRGRDVAHDCLPFFLFPFFFRRTPVLGNIPAGTNWTRASRDLS